MEVRRYSADTPNNPRQAGRSPDEGGYRLKKTKKFALGAIRYKAGARPQKGDSLAGELQ